MAIQIPVRISQFIAIRPAVQIQDHSKTGNDSVGRMVQYSGSGFRMLTVICPVFRHHWKTRPFNIWVHLNTGIQSGIQMVTVLASLITNFRLSKIFIDQEIGRI